MTSLRVFVALSLFIAGSAFAGSISGHATEAGGGPLEGVRVDVCYQTNCFTHTTTAADGSYRFDGLTAATYNVIATNKPYVSQYYNGLDCAYCHPLLVSPSPVVVTADGETTNIDFALRLGGSISGTVRLASNNEPIFSFGVLVSGPLGVGIAQTAADGRYTVNGLPPGEYRVYTARQQSYINQVYPAQPCLTSKLCDSGQIDAGDPVIVTAGDDVPGIDFSVREYATISGTVTRSDGTPHSFRNVSIEDNTNGQYSDAGTNASGAYIRAIPPGTYVVSAGPSDGYGAASSAPVVMRDTNITGIDLVLPVTTAKVQGTIRDRNGNPFANVYVALMKGGIQTVSGTTDASGQYTFPKVTPGRYSLKAVDEVDPTAHDLAEGSTTTIDMQLLSERTTFTGKATKGAANGPAVKLTSIDIFESNGTRFSGERTFQSSADGTYSLAFISRGTAFHLVAYAAGVSPTQSPGSPSYCRYGVYCPTVPPIAAGTHPDINFVMAPYGTIRGTVTEKGTGNAIPNAPVNFWRDGVQAKQVQTDTQGRYEWTEAYGSYQVYVPEWLNNHYAGQVYPEKDCSGICDASVGTAVSVSSGGTTANIDFHLTMLRGGTISGTVKDSSTGQPVAGAPVRFEQNGTDVAVVTTNNAGNYVWSLANGSYHVYVPQFGSNAYWGQVYPAKDCNGVCTPSVGTLVTATFDVTKNKIDFHLTPAVQTGGISGIVVDDETGNALADVLVRAANSKDSESATTDAHGVYRVEPLPSGDYTVTATLPPYFAATFGAPVRVTSPDTTGGIDLRMTRMQVTSISPSNGPLAGGTWITINGKNFPDGAKVKIGGIDATIVSVTPVMIVAITPANAAGVVDVVVYTSAQQSMTVPNGFAYTTGSSKRRSSRH